MPKFFTWLNNRLTLQDPIATSTGAADAGKIVALNSAGMVDALATRDSNFQRRRAEIYSDFIGGFGEWTSTINGTGAANSVTATTTISNGFRIAGIANQSTGSTATGRAALTTSAVAFKLLDQNVAGDRCPAYFRAIFQIPTVSDAIDSFIYRVGFIDNNSAESTDGVFLRISASNVAQFVARDNNVETVVSTGITFATGISYSIEIAVTSPTLATLKIYDTAINTNEDGGTLTTRTVTTNIPIGSMRLTGAGSYLQKTLGINARTINLDFMYAGIDL